MTVQVTVLNSVAFVMLEISVWSGAKKLEPRDFINVDVDDLPSSRVASYGIKHLIDKERLQPFKTIRGQAERSCARYGTRLLGGYAIPLDCVDRVADELEELCDKFEAEIDSFMSQYDSAIEDWISTNPEFADPLRRAMLPRGQVRSRFRASFRIFEVAASPRDKSNSMENVGTDLLNSVLASVLTSIKPQLDRKSGATDWFRVEVRQIIGEAAQKMRRFAFCEPSGGMKVLADELEASVSGTGKIDGAEFAHLWSIISRFTSVDAVKDEINARASGLPNPRPNEAPRQLKIIQDDFGFPMGKFNAADDTFVQPEVEFPPIEQTDQGEAFPFEFGEDSDDPVDQAFPHDRKEEGLNSTKLSFDF